MAINWSTLVYLPTQDIFSRQIIVTPLASGGAPFTARGIFGTTPVDPNSGEFGMMISDQKTILDIREREFLEAGHALPQQGDLIYIPSENEIPEEGDWEVIDPDVNGGGEMTLTIRRWTAQTAMPVTGILQSSISPMPYGTKPIFTMTLAASDASFPVGVVRFTVDNAIRSYVTVTGGVASWSPGWSLRVGNHTIVADFYPTNPLMYQRASQTILQVVTP